VFASPVVGHDGTVYVGSLDGQFVALNADGTLKWRYAAGQKVYPSALLVGTSVIFGTHQQELVSLSLDGQPRWKVPLQDVVDASATLGPDGRVVGKADQNLFCPLNDVVVGYDVTLRIEYKTRPGAAPHACHDGNVHHRCTNLLIESDEQLLLGCRQSQQICFQGC